MKKCICLLCFMLCTALCLTACAKPEPAAPGLTYAELMSTVRRENENAEIYTVLNKAYPADWSAVDGRIWVFGGWYASSENDETERNLFITCDPDGSDVIKVPLQGVETAEYTVKQLQDDQQPYTTLQTVFVDPSGALYAIQCDAMEREVWFEENGVTLVQYPVDRACHYLRTVMDDGVLSEPVLLRVPDEYLEITHAFFDKNGNLWADVCSDPTQEKVNSALLCFSPKTGKLLKTVTLPDNTAPDYAYNYIFLPDGDLVVHAKSYDRMGDYGSSLFYIVRDLTGDRPVLVTLSVPENLCIDDATWMIASSDPDSGDIFVSNSGEGIYRWNIDNGEIERVLKWEDYNIRFRDVTAILNLSATEWLIVLQKENYGTLSFVNITVIDELLFDGREVITVAVPGQAAENVQQAANDYNYTDPATLVKVLDYSDVAAAAKGFASGSEMLNNDIISGNVPDIVLVSVENITSHIRKGLFTDLYPFIDADADLSRADFVAGTLAATEQDGTLPTVLLSYNLLTAVGDPDVVGGALGWTWEEFYSVLAANPQAKTPYYLYDRYYVLLYQLMLGGSDYLDYSTGTAHLGSPEFIRVLESSAAYPAESGDYTADPKPVFAARQSLLNIQFIGDFRSVIAQNYAFDGPVVYKGFPSDAGGGSAFTSVLRGGITSYCTDPDAAWQFLRTLLLPEFQDNIQHSLPVRRDSLQKLAQAAAEPGQMAGLPPYLAGVPLTESQQEYWKRGVTEEEAAALLALIESTDVLYQYDSTIASILWEEADYFYNGVRTAEEAAALIQSRVQTYLAEQG